MNFPEEMKERKVCEWRSREEEEKLTKEMGQKFIMDLLLTARDRETFK